MGMMVCGHRYLYRDGFLSPSPPVQGMSGGLYSLHFWLYNFARNEVNLYARYLDFRT